MSNAMAPAAALLILTVSALIFVPLALTERSSLLFRSLYVLSAMLFGLALGLMLISLEPRRNSSVTSVRPSFGQQFQTVGVESGSVIEVEIGMNWAVRALGIWIAIIGAGELLRLILKRTANTQLLGPVILFLAGVLLIEQHWVVGCSLAVSLIGLVTVSIWRGTPRATGSTTEPASSTPA